MYFPSKKVSPTSCPVFRQLQFSKDTVAKQVVFKWTPLTIFRLFIRKWRGKFRTSTWLEVKLAAQDRKNHARTSRKDLNSSQFGKARKSTIRYYFCRIVDHDREGQVIVDLEGNMCQVQGTKTQSNRPLCQCAGKMPNLWLISRMEGLRCPCFGYRRSGKPRNLKYKSNLREEMEKHQKANFL